MKRPCPNMRLFCAMAIGLSCWAASSFGQLAGVVAVKEKTEMPSLETSSASLKLKGKLGEKTYEIVGKDSLAAISLPKSVEVWLNGELLEAGSDYTIHDDNGLRIEFDSKHALKKKDEIEVRYSYQRKNIMTGKPFSMAELEGQVVVVDLWATWCGPCVKEIPDFIKFQEAHKKEQFTYVGVSLDDDDPKNVRDFAAKKLKVNYPILMGDRAFVESLRPILGQPLEGIPTKFVLNRQGHVVFTLTGSPKGTPIEKDFENRLTALLQEPIPPKKQPVSLK